VSTVVEIQQAIARLPESEQRCLARWFAEVLSDAWDGQIENDMVAGRLDHLAEEALEEFHTGQTKAFPPDEKPSQ
jgi:hypothetical protein